jgi:hydrogenase maturation protease
VKKVLVIGYGNTLRSDDGVGVWVADRIAALHLPDVDVKTCHQLFPELAADILPYETVIMVDASTSGEPITVRQSIPPPEHLPSSSHNISPEILHHLAHEMYGATVDMRVYTVRGDSFEFGSMLSPSVKEQATKTVALIVALLQQIHPKSMIASSMLN